MKSDGKWKKLPLVYCAACRKCKRRDPEWKNLFDTWYLVRCTDINGTHIRTIIPGVLWCVDWCKVCTNKRYR